MYFYIFFLILLLAFFEHAGTTSPETTTPLVVTVSSDRGLCGGIHSSVSKATKRFLAKNKDASVVILGQKAKSQITREYKMGVKLTFDGVAKNAPTWMESALIADEILNSKQKFEAGKIFYNSFKSLIAFETKTLPIYSTESIKNSCKFFFKKK